MIQFSRMQTSLPDKVKILWTATMGRGGVKANVDAYGQEGGKSQILLKLCGRHKWMPLG